MWQLTITLSGELCDVLRIWSQSIRHHKLMVRMDGRGAAKLLAHGRSEQTAMVPAAATSVRLDWFVGAALKWQLPGAPSRYPNPIRMIYCSYCGSLCRPIFHVPLVALCSGFGGTDCFFLPSHVLLQ